MSNTLIAWAAFYPVLSVAFGTRPGGTRKSAESLNFPGFASHTWPLVRPIRAFTPRPGQRIAVFFQAMFLVKTAA
jgi:hypothetical protein